MVTAITGNAERAAAGRRPPAQGNRERIIQGTIELMNRQGGTAGTTLIAEYCQVSPGNLYYHFRNRESILREIFARLETDLGDVLQTQDGEEIISERMAGFYNAGAQVLWRYRFLFGAATEIFFRDPALAEKYRQFSQRSIAQIQKILELVTYQQPGLMPADRDVCAHIAEKQVGAVDCLATLRGNQDSGRRCQRGRICTRTRTNIQPA